MHVRKFEADTLDEALKSIKRELGPDAIILKTITNKGLKGAFKKKKIEITAAVSEKDFTQKTKVDSVLNEDQKSQFYSSDSSFVSSMIQNHNERSPAMNGYGNIGLNKKVRDTKTEAAATAFDDQLSIGLESFLQSGNAPKQVPVAPKQRARQEEVKMVRQEPKQHVPNQNERNKLDELEKKLFELTKNFEKIEKQDPLGLTQIRSLLRGFNISEKYINELVKKAVFEFGEADLNNDDLVFEFALREMLNEIETEMPLFSSTENKKESTITVFLSEMTSGQSSIVQKIGALEKDVVIIRNVKNKSQFTDEVFNLKTIHVNGIGELVSAIRKSVEKGKTIFVDYKNLTENVDETKKFVDGLRRGYQNVEVILNLSAIHSQTHNRRVIEKYKSLGDGISISHVDMCLDFGMLFNLAQENKSLPYMFFGTGQVIPSDVETATGERVLAGIFNF